jgi:NhaP-type Na+/H+ or K+/H+ antiporter
MDLGPVLLIALFLLLVGLVSGRLERSVLTLPMVFVTFGLLIGPVGLNFIHLEVESEVIHLLAEATLVLVLFTDASRIDLKMLRRDHQLPLRLLGLGLPLTIAFGALIATVMFEQLSVWEAAVVAAILAPTDAALGQAVVSSPRVPVRIRQALNIESGLNDGIALPFVLILLSFAGAAEEAQPLSYWLQFAFAQLVFGSIVGIAVGYLGGKMVSWGMESNRMTHTFQQLVSLSLALAAFAGAELIGGNGFIAAFTAGLILGNTSRHICGCLYEFAEAEGLLLTLMAFMVFGAAAIWPAAQQVDVTVVLYALLSLTVIRMLPVSISLLGSGVRPATHAFLGWFGPRGLASILYVLLVLERVQVEGREAIFTIVIMTVLLSVFAHGLTAWPGASWYAEHADGMRAKKPDCPELIPVSEMPVRVSFKD